MVVGRGMNERTVPSGPYSTSVADCALVLGALTPLPPRRTMMLSDAKRAGPSGEGEGEDCAVTPTRTAAAAMKASCVFFILNLYLKVSVVTNFVVSLLYKRR